MKIKQNIKIRSKFQHLNTTKHTISAGIILTILTASVVCEAADPNSVGIIQKVIQNITNLIKTDGKIGLQIISAAAGSIAAAKTVSWQPLVVGAGGAGILEVIFQAIG